MKKKTQSIKTLTIITILLITCITVYLFLKGKLFSVGTPILSTDKLVVMISDEIIHAENGNIYDVEYGQQLSLEEGILDFETVAKAQIRGEKVSFTNYYSESKDYKEKNIKNAEGKTCLENNILAAIISGFETKGYKYISEEDGEYYSSETQLAIWEFWNKWVESSGAKDNGFEKGMGNATIIENGKNGEEIRKKAQELATKETYNANIYFLKYFSHNNSQLIDNQSNLILVEVLDQNGDIIDFRPDIEDNSEVSLIVTNNVQDILKPEEEFTYTITVYNKSDESDQNLTLRSELSKGVSVLKVVEVLDDKEIELKENTDYNYNKETNYLTLDINNLESAIKETTENGETGEVEETLEMNFKKYQITVMANKLDKGIYSRTIKNIVSIQKENKILLRDTTTNTVSDIILEVETDKLPEELYNGQEFVIGLKVTNKGLINAENININISIPEVIVMNTYKIDVLSETGEVESSNDGTASNEFEHNSIGMSGEKTLYLKLYGTVDEIEEEQQITIKGKVNNQEISWTSNVKGGR